MFVSSIIIIRETDVCVDLIAGVACIVNIGAQFEVIVHRHNTIKYVVAEIRRLIVAHFLTGLIDPATRLRVIRMQVVKIVECRSIRIVMTSGRFAARNARQTFKKISRCFCKIVILRLRVRVHIFLQTFEYPTGIFQL